MSSGSAQSLFGAGKALDFYLGIAKVNEQTHGYAGSIEVVDYLRFVLRS